ncbi:MAG: GAF domain-containing protein [Deltaproteobacteria bacterium]|nr:MAG: GAF domain-containing protein [Deltaproteobacteria bacterium]
MKCLSLEVFCEGYVYVKVMVMDALLQQAIENCANEPIHTPNAIQSFGAVVVLDTRLQRTTHASQNAGDYFSCPVQDLLGQPAVSYLTPKVIHNIRNAQLADLANAKTRLGICELSDGWFDLSLHQSSESLVLELERAHDKESTSSLMELRFMLAKIHEMESLEQLLSVAVETLRWTSGFKRVMAYRFLHNGDGEVVAEECCWSQEPYLGLRYPASDIPPQARDLFFRNPIRVISDVSADSVPLLTEFEDAPLLDLSLSTLRAVSPVHLAYLRNMEVTASMTLPLIVNQRLWGLIACHADLVPRYIRPEKRLKFELFGQMLSMQLELLLAKKKAEKRAQIQVVQHTLMANPQLASEFALAGLAQSMNTLVPSDGLALWLEGKWHLHGIVPPREALSLLLEQAAQSPEASVMTFESLSEAFPGVDFSGLAGALLLSTKEPEPARLLFFRCEFIQHVRWGGDPKGVTVSLEEHGPQLHPRSSFAAYVEQVSGHCMPWSTEDTLAAEEICSTWLAQLSAQGGTSSQKQEWLVGELNHRIKNILALIQSITRQTRRNASSLEQYAQMLEYRISALARAHEHDAADLSSCCSLNRLLHRELAPYLSRERILAALSGDEIFIHADASVVLSLVFHELVTNAVKYGALSHPDNQLDITWVLHNEKLQLYWRERCVSPISLPDRKGFGSILIERTIPYELKGDVDMRFHPNGLEVDLWFPAELIVSAAIESLDTWSSPSHAGWLSQHRILLLEDNALLALDTVETLKELGCMHTSAVASLEQARTHLESQSVSLALLDIQLGQETSFAFAEELRQAELPCAFVTGYSDAQLIPESLRSIPVLEKPVKRKELYALLEGVFLEGASTYADIGSES